MEQLAVLTQTPQPEKVQNSTDKLIDKLMRPFFTEDASPDKQHIGDLQRRALWLGVALVLQAPNEPIFNLISPLLGSAGSILPFLLIGGSFVAVFMAFRPAKPPKPEEEEQSCRLRRWQKIAMLWVLFAALVGIVVCIMTVVMTFLPPRMSNDGTSLDTNAAILLLEGKNPYTDSNMLSVARRFSIQPNWTTPLQVGQFVDSSSYPSATDMQSVFDTDMKSGKAPEFESKVSYPALSFLTLVPFVWANDYNVLPLYLLSYLALIFIGWKYAPNALRPWVLVLGLANISMWSSTYGSNLDIFSTLLVVGVWMLRDRRWTSTLLLGLAFASKQTSWFLAPFYAILIWRTYGWKEMLTRTSVAGVVFLACNLPFILWDPRAWLAGVLAPVADPMFPLGVGLVGFSVTHLIPLLPKWVYTVLEGIAMLGSLIWYWRTCKKLPESAILLAVLPLFVAWRSLSSYFYCVIYPIFILMVAHPPLRKQKHGAANFSFAWNTGRNQQRLSDLPAPAGAYFSSYASVNASHRWGGYRL